MDFREKLKDKQRIVIKIGSSSITHAQTGALNLTKLEVLVRELCNLKRRDPGLFRSYRRRQTSRRISSPPIQCGRKTGLCCDRPGAADDDVSEALL